MSLHKEEFFSCSSMPRNRELMRVFKDVGLVEQLGSGMSRILKAYHVNCATGVPQLGVSKEFTALALTKSERLIQYHMHICICHHPLESLLFPVLYYIIII
ncbi:MAG: ATP-binding protein [Lachnospiraceae bacterium]